MALIRYPGSKEKLATQIIARFPWAMYAPLWMDLNKWEYREPFFGAGAVGFKILERLPPSCSAWINDIDYGLICMWQAVQNDIKRLCAMIETFKPSVEKFYEFQEDDGNKDRDPLEMGFRKLALHQMSYSGLGFKSGGPLGGRNQDNSLYNVGCRYSDENLNDLAVRLNKILTRANVRITCRDYTELIDDNEEVFLYLDPPYFEKGEELYKHDLTPDDHKHLASLLRETKNKWVLSYDDHPEIRQLYSWAHIAELEIIYTAGKANGPSRPKNKEVLITPQIF